MDVGQKLIYSLISKLLLILVFTITVGKTANGQCNAAFNASLAGCSDVQFSDLSNVDPGWTITGWNWDFGDGNSSTVQNPFHTYAPGSPYIAQLTITADSSGFTCTDVATNVVTVPPLPTVYVTWDPEPTCLGGATSFYSTSSNPIVSWNWDFGDGLTSNIQNPVHLYALPGAYTVSLIVTDVNGCSDTSINTVNVGDIPNVDFTFSPDPTCANSTTNFFGTSSVSTTITSWTWDFGDGSFAFTKNAIHNFIASGTYTVSLTVEDTNGCTNTVSYPVEVNELPTANFFHDGPACEYDSVNFTNVSTTPSGYIARWEWDFGDGTSTTIIFPDDPNVSHLYPNPGTFQVVLTVTTSDSCVNSTFREVIIQPQPIADFTFVPDCQGEPVSFTDLSSPNGGNSIVSWYWEFGDPNSGIFNTSTLQNPTHIFTDDGTFSVLLIVTNTDNCVDSITKDINISDLPDVEITVDSDTVCINALTNFYGSGSANIVTWLWDFGDGGTSVLQNPQHTYSSPGNYLVSLTGTDDNGCDSTATYLMTVNPPPTADFATSAPACEGEPIDFFDQSNAPNGWLTQYHWYFGDGTDTIVLFPDPPNVTHTYAVSGSYIASLVITSNAGCIDSITHEVTVSVSPMADFSAGEPRCEGNLIQFFDESLGFGAEIQTWSWNFGDPSSGSNNISSLQNPYHLFANAGTYNVYLEVTNQNGCSDTVSIPVEIYGPPPVYFNISPSGGVCQNDTAYFTINTDTTNTSTILSYFWDFGDPASGTSDTSSLMNPWHIFSSFGTYTVTLTVSDTSGCSNSITLPVDVLETPDADFIFSAACFGDSTSFTDMSVPGEAVINSWFWKFNDPGQAPGDTSNIQNPWYTFSSIDDYYVELTVSDNNGCSSTAGRWVEVFDTPSAGFTFYQFCDPPGMVQFFDESTFGSSGSPLQTWEWELDDGYFSSEINPLYVYDELDTCYIINLTVTDANGCSDTYSDTICLFGEVSVDFAADQVCFKQVTTFQGIYQPSSDSIAEWNWDFGDGTPIYSTPHDTAAHIYPSPGEYLVTLSVKDVNGCSASTIQTVRVDSLPTPNFTTDTAFCDETTSFFDLSVGNGTFIQSWEWNFGDISSPSNTSTAQFPTHFYNSSDSVYMVSLIVSNYYGCYDSITRPVYKGPCVSASLEPVYEPFCSGNPACFANTSLFYGASGGVDEYIINYGDGTTDIFTSYPDTLCHIYADSGIYQLSFVLSADVSGSTFTDTAFLEVEVFLSPTADFTSYYTCTNEVTTFESIDDTALTIVDWRWDFGDLTTDDDTANISDPGYLYPGPGFYDVELQVTSSRGCTDTLLREIEVYDPPVAEFELDPACIADPTNFYDISEPSGPDIYAWLWDFGDPTSAIDTSVIAEPSYVYPETGNYDVSLIIEDMNFCRDTVVKTIRVYDVPESGFEIIENYEGTQGQLYLENISIDAETYEWDFGNGETSIEESPVVKYTLDGTYDIVLIAYNEHGCPDTTLIEYKLMFKGLFIPSAFQLEGAREVRAWKPTGINMKRYRVEVYSLWGNLLWSSTKLDADGSPTEAWNGRINNNSGDPVVPGNYIWKASATFRDGTLWRGMLDDDGESYRTSGTITMFR